MREIILFQLRKLKFRKKQGGLFTSQDKLFRLVFVQKKHLQAVVWLVTTVDMQNRYCFLSAKVDDSVAQIFGPNGIIPFKIDFSEIQISFITYF